MSLFRQAIEKWGYEAQENKLIEELGELIVAIMKCRQKPSTKATENLYEEITDVFIMIRQFVWYYQPEPLFQEIWGAKFKNLRKLVASKSNKGGIS